MVASGRPCGTAGFCRSTSISPGEICGSSRLAPDLGHSHRCRHTRARVRTSIENTVPRCLRLMMGYRLRHVVYLSGAFGIGTGEREGCGASAGDDAHVCHIWSSGAWMDSTHYCRSSETDRHREGQNDEAAAEYVRMTLAMTGRHLMHFQTQLTSPRGLNGHCAGRSMRAAYCVFQCSFFFLAPCHRDCAQFMAYTC